MHSMYSTISIHKLYNKCKGRNTKLQLEKDAKSLHNLEDCWEGSPTLANLGNCHCFISKEYIPIGTRPFREAQIKVMRAYAQSGQYPTFVV